MAFVNNVMIIRRDLLTRMAELYKEGSLLENIDRIPIEIVKRLNGSERCCRHKARAVVKYKVMAVLGFGSQDEKDELDNLAYYADQVIHKGYKPDRFLTVVDEACTSCVKANYIVTNLCKGCIAQPCMNNCPRKAISRTESGKALIDPEMCVNCGICKELCPYHSIVYMPVPCEESCPVGAITKDGHGVEHIDGDKCILCGKCINACPFGSIMESTDLFDVMRLLLSGSKVNALIAPSIFGQFSIPPGAVFDALYKLGFTNVFEVAEGAADTTQHEALELAHKLERGQPFMTTSCCPSWVLSAQNHIPEMVLYISTTLSPMAFTAQKSRKSDPDVPVVFIGPCVAKRKEGFDNPDVDWVLTFEELACLFNGWKVPVMECENLPVDTRVNMQSRNYCQSGGVAEAVKNHFAANFSIKIVNGIDKKQLRMLSSMAKTKQSEAQFIEIMSCEGGCLAGPCSHEFPKDARRFYTRNTEELYKAEQNNNAAG
jgi:[FeFe] hydrogenase (group B1/B3)